MKIKSIHIYPIKSLAGIALQTSNVQERGLEHDRRWLLVDAKGLFQSQRDFPQMALFEVFLKTEFLLVKAPDGAELQVPFVPVGGRMTVSIWDDVVEGVEVSSKISKWFSAHLGKEVHLIKMISETNRLIDLRYASNAETVSFADGYPILLTNTASLTNLNEKLSNPIEMNRFRPNIIIDGQVPFEEDNWTNLSIGTAKIEVVKRCARCVVVNIDPKTADKDKEVLQTLYQYRKTGNKVQFGVNALIHKNGIITVGDELKF